MRRLLRKTALLAIAMLVLAGCSSESSAGKPRSTTRSTLTLPLIRVSFYHR
jgi:predicted component of type VI protein secretion system